MRQTLLGYVRSKRKRKSAIGHLEGQDDTVISENQEKADLLNRYFASVFQKELNTISVILNKVSTAIDRVKSSKSQRPDNKHPMIIKECKNALLLKNQLKRAKSQKYGKQHMYQQFLNLALHQNPKTIDLSV